MKMRFCFPFFHQWNIIFSEPPKIVKKCLKCGKTISTMYDMAWGTTYWIEGDHWS